MAETLKLAVDNTGKPPETDPEKLKVFISVGEATNRGRIRRKGILWRELAEKLTTKNEDKLYTDEQFAKLPESRQAEIKAAPGFFVGGVFEGQKRLVTKVKERWVLTFDIDDCSDAWFSEIFDPFDSFLADIEYAAHTTRSHRPDKKRIRLAIPLGSPVPPDLAMALTRLIARRFDPDMETVDRVSFRPAQVMYWPSSNRNTEHYKSLCHYASLINPSDVLAEWDGKPESLPRHPLEADPYADAGKIGIDATKKPGVIGAFNRVFPISRLMEERLSDVYEATEETNLYRYKLGHGVAGVRVYDLDTRVYSYHGSDPAGGKNLHSFDLEMIHRFGHLNDDDGNGEEPKRIQDTKAYKAMVQEALSIPEVTLELARYTDLVYGEDDESEGYEDEPGFEVTSNDVPPGEQLEVTSFEPGSLPQEIIPTGRHRPRGWRLELDRNPDATLKPTLGNVIKIISYDRRFRGCVAYNKFSERNVLRKRIECPVLGYSSAEVIDNVNGDVLPDEVYGVIGAILGSTHTDERPGYGLPVGKQMIIDACDIVGKLFSFHPVRDFLRDCYNNYRQFDVEASDLFPKYFRTADNSYTRDAGVKVLVASVARMFEPGHKFDFMPVLCGPEGFRKSSGIKVMSSPEWFVEFMPGSIEDGRKLVENIHGKLFAEMAELAAMKGRELSSVKRFLSAQSETIRPAYGRNAKDYARQTTMWGTVNPEDRNWLAAEAEHRRFWPMDVLGMVDTDSLERDRAALWGEAVAIYIRMRAAKPVGILMLDLEEENKPLAKAERAKHVDDSDSDLVGMIAHWLNTPVSPERAAIGFRPSFEDDVDDSGADLVLRRQTCVRDVVKFVLELDDKNIPRPISLRVGAALSRVPGWRKAEKKAWTKTLGDLKAWERDDEDSDL